MTFLSTNDIIEGMLQVEYANAVLHYTSYTDVIAIGVIGHKAADYLITKYGSEFSFLSNGDDVWSSKSKSLIFSYEEGREFTVKENSGYFTDNYASVLFDTGASKDVNAFFGEDTKIYVNTMSVFFPSAKIFHSASEYLKDCSVVNVAIFTKRIGEYDSIAETLRAAMGDCTVYAVIYCVDEAEFASVCEYKSLVNTIASESFWIDNDEISSRSWEE